MQDSLYSVLEVEESADPAELRRAFMHRAQQWHPDKAPEGERAAYEAKFQRLSEAYETLSDTRRRARYDEELRWQRRPRTAYAERPDFRVRDTGPRPDDFRWRDMGSAEPRAYQRTYTRTTTGNPQANAVWAMSNMRLLGAIGIPLVMLGGILLIAGLMLVFVFKVIAGLFNLLFGWMRPPAARGV